ncbi:hypothetical protein F4780DRAFT_783946 [Xylariomycetidae sp. FL0641]|nr:hypothetical protein F4780DRAFT_783946 [Xylariomycetidae sp. FL0641]
MLTFLLPTIWSLAILPLALTQSCSEQPPPRGMTCHDIAAGAGGRVTGVFVHDSFSPATIPPPRIRGDDVPLSTPLFVPEPRDEAFCRGARYYNNTDDAHPAAADCAALAAWASRSPGLFPVPHDALWRARTLLVQAGACALYIAPGDPCRPPPALGVDVGNADVREIVGTVVDRYSRDGVSGMVGDATCKTVDSGGGGLKDTLTKWAVVRSDVAWNEPGCTEERGKGNA